MLTASSGCLNVFTKTTTQELVWVLRSVNASLNGMVGASGQSRFWGEAQHFISRLAEETLYDAHQYLSG